MKESDFFIPARDGFSLATILLECSGEPKGVVQISGGTGIKKEFYLNFARYLCENGYHVMLFDYRGIGQSRPASLRGFHATMSEWGIKDMSAILDWIHNRFGELPIFFLGHSAGGQQFGLMDNHHKVALALFISTSVGYWKWLTSPYKYFTLLVWYVIVPITNRMLGYVPASSFKLGEDLPKNVAMEWRKWCLSETYFGKDLGTTIPIHFYSKVKTPIHFLYPEDDTIATDRSVKALQQFYVSAPQSIEKIILKEYDLSSVGHLGFFSRKVKNVLWSKVLDHFSSSRG